METAAMAVVVAILIGLLALQRRDHTRERARWYVERNQLMARYDALVEAVARQTGNYVDLNRAARDRFKDAVSGLVGNRAASSSPFGKGWRSDKPATAAVETTVTEEK